MSNHSDDQMRKVVEKALGTNKNKPYLEIIAGTLTKKPSSLSEASVADSLEKIASSLERIANALEKRD